jgi:hypothetical protein
MARLTARFSVTGWDEQALDGIDGDWVGAVRMSKSFSTGLIGTSSALFASSGPVEGERAYVAIERIEGTTDDGLTGSVTVHHGGLESDPTTWFGHVVPHSGTGDFADWRGSARIEHDDEGASMVFDLAENG